MTIDNIITLIIAILSTGLGVLAFILVTRKKRGYYDQEHQKVILDETRNYFEKQIYAMNDRLIQSEERWKDVNHLLLRKEYLDKDNLNFETRKTSYTQFLKSNGILENDMIVDSRLIFVLTPFNNKYYNEFKTIQVTCEAMGFRCIRGDEEQFKGDIFPEMLKYMVRAKIIIANINGRNPNVLYELGVAQALDKNVILVAKEPKDLPIDIQSQKFLIYSDSNDLANSLKIEIGKLR